MQSYRILLCSTAMKSRWIGNEGLLIEVAKALRFVIDAAESEIYLLVCG